MLTLIHIPLLITLNTNVMEFITSNQFVYLIMILYIVIPLLALIVLAWKWISGSPVQTATFDKLIEIGKWYIVSVALAFSTKILETGYKEREYALKEMATFDKHIETITDVEGVEKRWRLVNYYAIVTPSENLRERWIVYKEYISGEHQEYMHLKEEVLALKNKPSLSPEDLIQLKNKNRRIQEMDRPYGPMKMELMIRDSIIPRNFEIQRQRIKRNP